MKKFLIVATLLLVSISWFSVEKQFGNQSVPAHIKVYTGDPGY
ncbi:hypothetical protein ACLMAB_05750 [Brevibacillus laterosporus]